MKKLSFIFCFILVCLTLTSCKGQDSKIETTTAFDVSLSQTQVQTSAELTSTLPITTKQTTTTQTTTVFETTTTETVSESTTILRTQENTSSTYLTQNETTTTVQKTNCCYVSIYCNTINDNLDMLNKAKKEFVASDGIIIENAAVQIENEDSVFEIIKKACNENTCKNKCKYCKQSGIQIEYTYTPTFNNYYIEGIHQLYEKDCGMQSGWMYSVNGQFPNVGVSEYKVKAGDQIVFAYTCDMGEDVGNIY